jgi:hypothetical protein
MAKINDGGNFSDDMLTRLAARSNGGSMSLDELDAEEAQHRQLKEDALNMAMGTAGTIRNVGQGIRVLPGVKESGDEAVGAAKNFFEKYGREAKGMGRASDAADDATRLYQQKLRDQAIAERNALQEKEAYKTKFQQLMKAMGKE